MFDILDCQVYYISFEPSPLTEKTLRAQNFTNINHVEAIDARHWDDNRLRELVAKNELSLAGYESVRFGRPIWSGFPSTAALGCTLTHRACWVNCRPGEIIVIAEDDVRFFRKAQLSDMNKFFQESNAIGVGRVFMCTLKIMNYGTHFYALDYAACQTLLTMSLPMEIQLDTHIQALGKCGYLTIVNNTNIATQKLHKSTIQTVAVRDLVGHYPANIIALSVLVITIIILLVVLKIVFSNCNKMCTKSGK